MDHLSIRQSLRLHPPTLVRENHNDPAECMCYYCSCHSLEEFIEPVLYGGVTKRMIKDSIKRRATRCVRYVYPVYISDKHRDVLNAFCEKHFNVGREKFYNYSTNTILSDMTGHTIPKCRIAFVTLVGPYISSEIKYQLEKQIYTFWEKV
jgi:hypothetical protein